MKNTIVTFGPDPKNPALAGGAYITLMKKVFPQNCRTELEAAAAYVFFKEIEPWINEQEQEIKEAYIWSVNYMKAIIDENLIQAKKHEASCLASLSIPKPPGL